MNAHPLISATPVRISGKEAEPTEYFLKGTIIIYPGSSVTRSLPSLAHLWADTLPPPQNPYAIHGVWEDREEWCGKLTSRTGTARPCPIY
jgi:hypothetical protein